MFNIKPQLHNQYLDAVLAGLVCCNTLIGEGGNVL